MLIILPTRRRIDLGNPVPARREVKSLFPRAPFRQHDLLLQKVGERDPLGFERLRIERGRGQPRQSVGFEKALTASAMIAALTSGANRPGQISCVAWARYFAR